MKTVQRTFSFAFFLLFFAMSALGGVDPDPLVILAVSQSVGLDVDIQNRVFANTMQYELTAMIQSGTGPYTVTWYMQDEVYDETGSWEQVSQIQNSNDTVHTITVDLPYIETCRFYRVEALDHGTGMTASKDIYVTTYYKQSIRYGFEENAQGWDIYEMYPGQATPTPVFTHENGQLCLQGVGYNTQGMLQSPEDDQSYYRIVRGNPTGFRLTPGVLYRFRYKIATDISEQSKVPVLRLRSAASDNEDDAYVWIESKGTPCFSPTLVPFQEK